jgi:hypothetical protein
MLSRFLRGAALPLSFVLAASAAAQTTATLQNGLASYAGAVDVKILNAAPTTNHEGPTFSLTVSREADVTSTLIRFAIFQAEGGPVPNNATITSAVLSLYKYSGGEATIKASRLLKNWTPSQATWNVAATSTSWTSAGANGSGTDYVAAADGQAFVAAASPNSCGAWPTTWPAVCWLNIDVTAGVQAFKANPGTNYGWKLAYVSGGDQFSNKDFNPSEYTHQIARPKLTITYTVEPPPTGCSGDNEPTDTDPAGSLGTAVPTFHSMSLYYNPAAASPALNPAVSNETVWMRYRRACETTWREGWRLWADPRTTGNSLPYAYPARGSAVYLEPNTKYYFQFGTGASFSGATWHHHVAGTTWSETFAQDGAAVTIPNTGGTCPAAGPCVITQGGSATTGYKVYDGCQAYSGSVCTTKGVINRGGAGTSGGPTDTNAIDEFRLTGTAPVKWPDASFGLIVKADYVIVRNVVVTGAATAGILVYPNRVNVVIEDSEVTDWSWRAGVVNPSEGPQENPVTDWGTFGTNGAAGVHLSGGNSRIVVQRNKLFDPHFGSSPWDFGHPQGPSGVTIYDAGQQNVVRYNEIYSTLSDKKHWVQDGLTGRGNFSAAGAPGADSDVYHNNVRNAYDDTIEAEGGGRNVRVWGNYGDHVGVGIATASVHLGPTYVFRNVVNRVRQKYNVTLDGGQRGGIGFKAYGINGGFGGGRQYFFNNTLLQAPASAAEAPETASNPLGTVEGLVSGTSGGQGMRQTWSRNNILHIWKNSWDVIRVSSQGANPQSTNNFDYDVYNGDIIDSHGFGPHNVNGYEFVIASNPPNPPPAYKATHGWSAGPLFTYQGGTTGAGNFQLNPVSGNTGLQRGTHLPNFTTDIDNTALAAKSGVHVVSGTCNVPATTSATGDPGCPDVGAHQNTLSTPMKFGLPAAAP